MILKKFGCEQFAGIREQEFELKDHMNVIVGNNESGKTTMMDMIYHVLNTGVDLKRNEKKEFFEVFMPAEKTSGFSGDCVDGSVTFETEKGIFTIKKEWFREEDSSCRLKAEDGSVIKSKKKCRKNDERGTGIRTGGVPESYFFQPKGQGTGTPWYLAGFRR